MRARIAAAARALGVAEPGAAFDDLLAQTFARPGGDAAYGTNRLQPAGPPLEWSFSEAEPDALRVELQPLDPQLAPAERLRRALAGLLPLVAAHHGQTLAARFASVVEEATGGAPGPTAFGAFLGLSGGPRRPPELKLYVERGPGADDRWCSALPPAAEAVPHFRSVAARAGAVVERDYYLCAQGLRLLDLEGLCATLGMAHQFPRILLLILELCDGEFFLPPRSALLGIRVAEGEAELKVELVAGVALRREGLAARVERLLSPAAVAPYRRWLALVWTAEGDEPPVSVVSVRARAAWPPALSVYVPERWGAS